MGTVPSDRLRKVKTFKQLVAYLRDELDWPIEEDNFDELTFEYEPHEPNDRSADQGSAGVSPAIG